MATRTIADGGGTWSSLSTWVEGAVPTASDAVVATGTSGQLTVDTGAVCLSADFTNYTNTLTINASAAWTISTVAAGSALKLVAGMTVSAGASSVITFNGAPGGAATVTITTAGKSVPGITVNGGANLTVQFSDAFTTAGTITVTAGKFDTNGQTVVGAQFSSTGSTARTITLGSSNLTFTQATVGGALPAWSFGTGTNITFNAGTSTITANGSGATIGLGNSQALAYNNVVWAGSGGMILGFGSFSVTIANMTVTGSVSKTDNINITSTNACTVNGALTLTGNSATNRLLVLSTLGTSRTIALGAAATLRTSANTKNVDFQDITITGGAVNERDLSAITGGSGDALGNTGITFTPAATQFWFSGTGNWSDSTKWFLATAGGGGAGRVPLPQDNVRFDANSFTAGSQTITADMPRLGLNIDFTGTTNNPALACTLAGWIFGNFTAASGMTRGTSTASLQFYGRSSHTITTAAMQMHATAVNSAGGTYTCQDAFANTTSGATQHAVALGTFAANNQSITLGSLFSTGSNTRAINMGSGAWTMPSASAVAIVNLTATGMTLTTSTAVMSATGAPGGAITVTVSTGSVSMPSFTVNGGANLTVQFSDAFTTTGTVTLTAGKLDTNGQTCTFGAFVSSSSNTRTATFGSSPITANGAGSFPWDANGTTGLTVTANTATATLSAAGTGFRSGTVDWNGLSVVAPGSGSFIIGATGAFTVKNLTRTGTAVKTDSMNTNGPFTVSTTFTITGNSTINRVLVQSSVLGTTRTITCNGVCAHSNVDWQDITAAGTGAPFTGTSMGDALGNTNITFDAPVTRYGVVAGNWSSTATWSNASGGAGGFSVPLPQDTVILDASSVAGTYTIDMPRAGANLTCTGFTRTLTNTLAHTLFGNITLASGMTITNANDTIVAGRGSQTITSAGKQLNGGLQIVAFGGTYTQQDALSLTSSYQMINGTGSANNQTVVATAVTYNGSNTKTITMGSGAWTLNRSVAGNIWTGSSTGTTITPNTAIVSCTGAPGSAATVNWTTGGVTTMPSVTVNGGANLTVQLQDAFTTAGTITLTAGTLDTNSKTVSCQSFNLGNTTTRTLTLGSSSITATLVGGSAVTGTAITNLTVTANTAIFTLNGAASGVTSLNLNFQGASLVLSGSGTQYVSGSATFGSLTRTGTAVKTDGFEVRADLTITGQASFNGNSITNRLLVQSNILGTPRTITVNGTRAHSNVDFMDIAGAGTASTDLSAITGGSGDCGGNSGYTFTPAQTNYWRGNGGSWSDVTHWANVSGGGASTGRVPLPQDTARLDANSFSTGAQTVTSDMPRTGTTDFTGVTNTPTWGASNNVTFFGNLTGATVTRSGWFSFSMFFGGRGSQTITIGGMTNEITGPSFNAPNGTYTLQDASTFNTTFTLTAGTLNTNGQSVTGVMVMSGALTKVLTLGTTTWSTTLWSAAAAGATINASSSTITFSVASASTHSFLGAGFTYGTLSYTVAASTGPLVITGANTFANLTVTSEAGNAKTLTLPSATTTTITGARTLTGTVASPLVINASTPGSAATLLSTLGGTDNTNDSFVTLTDITEVIRRATITAAGATPSTSLSTHTTVCSSPAGSLSNPSPISPHINTCRAPGGSIPTTTSVHDHSTICSSPAGSLSRSATNLHLAIRNASSLAGSLSTTPTITKKGLNLTSRVFAGSIPTDIAAKQVSVLALLPSGGLMRDTEYQLVFIPKGRQGTILNSHRTRAVVV